MFLILFFISLFGSDSLVVDTSYISNSDVLVSNWLRHQRIEPLRYSKGTEIDTQFVLVNLNVDVRENIQRDERLGRMMNIIGGITMVGGLVVISLSPSKPYIDKSSRPVYMLTGLSLMGIGLFQVIAF